MPRGLLWPLVAIIALVLGGVGLLAKDWYGPGPLAQQADFIVPDGANLAMVAVRLQKAGAIFSPRAFRFHARLFGRGALIKAGEFALPAGASESRILSILAGDDALRRFVTIPEGMPAVLVGERLDAQTYLAGDDVKTPPEGSVLPQTYDFKRGETRAAVLARMRTAMADTLAGLWAHRAPGLPLKTAQEAVTLASIVEKETAKPSERPMVAGLYENRLRQRIMLQADPTIIYPLTQGRPLGRRIRQSEIAASNGYNTYAMQGLPRGPITNPGRAAIDAVLHPAKTDALYMVANGTGGHAFAADLKQHNANVERWFAIRHARGEL